MLLLRFSRAVVLISTVATVGGCTVGPDFERPRWASPSSWFENHPESRLPIQPVSTAAAEPVDPHWWRMFGDPELTSLVERVADSNLDVRVQTIRLAESRAQLGVTRADAFPQLNGNASYTREKISDLGVASLLGSGGSSSQASQANGLSGTQGGIPVTALSRGSAGRHSIPPFDLFQYGFDASWELDIWGRVRREIESADASVEQSSDARRNTLLNSMAEVARDYITYRGQQAQLQIARDNLRTAQQSLQLSRERALGGLTTDLDVANASAQVNVNAAQIPLLEQQLASSINALSLLLGQQPNALRDELGQARPVPPLPPAVPVGVPSELARRRPDIREAEDQLHSATADVGVAVADFYPQVTLSGSAGFQALQFHNLGSWNSRQYSFGPSVTLPIFQGGRLRATLELRKAQQQEAAVTYQRTVLNAWHEIDNALTAYRNEQVRRAQLTQAVNDARRAVGLAQSRYRDGLTDFLQVLDAERTLLNQQQSLADSTATASNNLVALYKALGGGWESDYPLREASASP